MRLGVFDSGIGGQAIAEFLAKDLPEAEIFNVNDKPNVPYGDKTAEEIIQLTDAAIQPLLAQHCDVIIIACNTATALAIESLRQKYPEQKFIGLEPMVKTAVELTRSGVVAVCATPATLSSRRYGDLKTKFSSNITVLEPDCQNWAYMIEHDKINHKQIASTINTICQQKADVIVLGCTHYHWIKQLITDLAAGRARVIDPSEAIVSRIRQLLG